MDLLSTIVFLKSRNDFAHLSHTGIWVNGWFFREINRKAPDFAEKLHHDNRNGKNKETIRPFTLSVLHKGPSPVTQYSQGDWYWLRITSLTKELSELLANEVLPDLLSPVRIGPAEFDVQKWKLSGGQNSSPVIETYPSLMRQGENPKETRLRFEFMSATSFKQAKLKNEPDIDVPLPNPERVFGSYLKYWAAYAGTSVPNKMEEFIQKFVAVNELDIKSERIKFSLEEKNRASTGFAGQVQFALLRPKVDADWPNWEHYANILRSLARFAYFCGTGQETAFGMGQTRLLT